MFNNSSVGKVLLIISLCFLSRLPQLLSPKMLLDGDECVLALMAKHQMEGKELPIFFWGQQHGFSTVETSFIALSYNIFGINAIAVKLAMLMLWAIGVVFTYWSLSAISTRRYVPELLTLLLILSPAWAVWSMKARGGYITSFTCSAIMLYILLAKVGAKTMLRGISAGLLLPVIFYSQRLWLAGLIPFVVYWLLTNIDLKLYLSFALALISGILLFNLLIDPPVAYYQIASLEINDQILPNTKRILLFLFYHLHGNYYLWYIYPSEDFAMVFALVFTIITCAIPVAGIYMLLLRKANTLFYTSILSVVLTLCYTVVIPKIEPRYLLPLTVNIILAVCIFLNQYYNKPAVYSVSLSLVIIGSFSIVNFQHHTFTRMREQNFQELNRYLGDRNVQYVFCPDNLLAWQITFYSKEKIITRTPNFLGRYPKYNRRVGAALDAGQPVALVGEKDVFCGFHVLPFVHFSEFFIVMNPTGEQLMNVFEFRPMAEHYH